MKGSNSVLDRTNAPPPFPGGLQTAFSMGQCTTGYRVVQSNIAYDLIASHCSQTSTTPQGVAGMNVRLTGNNDLVGTTTSKPCVSG